MKAREKMSNFFKETKYGNGEFGKLELDKKNKILINKKIKEIKMPNQSFRESREFVSHLYEGHRRKNNLLK